MDTPEIIDALPAHEAPIRAHSDATFQSHAARLPHAFGDENAFQHTLLDAVFHAPPNLTSDFRCKLLVALGDEKLMGYILIIWHAAKNGAVTPAVIADIGVFPEYEGRGVGRLLLAHAKSLMPQLGWQSLTADVWRDNAASHKIFSTMGFEAERTEYRFGPAPAPQKDNPPSKTPALSREHLLILLALAAGLLIYLTS
ncbi:MAG: GNAT family N-acetyltransferase [Sulfitobacter sp.]